MLLFSEASAILLLTQTEERMIMNTKLSPQAVNLLKRVRQQITEHPETYDQQNASHECGTACCIAGHINSISGMKSEMFGHSKSYTEMATAALGLRYDRQYIFGDPMFGFDDPKNMNGIESLSAAWGAQKITEFIEAHT